MNKCALYAHGICAVVLKASICSLYPMISKKKSKERPSLLEELEETKQKIGARIRQLRTEKGISQETFANQNGLDRTQVSRIERGLNNIELLSLVSFIRALDISLKDFFAGIE